jgi:nucleoid DNA-binding protein
MNKKELVAAIADETSLTKEKAGEVIDSLFVHIEKSLTKGEEVRVPGFGTFKVSHRAARTGLNPQTKAPIQLPATTVPRFTAAKSLKEAIAPKS